MEFFEKFDRILFMQECIFCKIVKGEIPSQKVYEDDKTIAFLDINPLSRGHTLVMPKQHFETLTDLPDDLASLLAVRLKHLASAISKTTGASGFNIIQNNRQVAGQLIPHVHFHIIPRFYKNDVEFGWPAKKADPEDLKKLAQEIKGAI
jgi:histidine triad (HIT) family protein